MNTRERINNVLNYEFCDQMPVIHFGYWRELLQEWVVQGHIDKIDADNWKDNNIHCLNISKKLGFDCGSNPSVPNNAFLCPEFESKVVKEFPDGSKHILDSNGVTVLSMPDSVGSIPAEIDHLLVDRESWEEHYLPRLQFNQERFPENMQECIEINNNATDYLPTLGCGSILGKLRDTIGLENLSYLQIDDPELLEEAIDTVGELSYQTAKTWFEAGLRVDALHWWEDICFNHGSLVSPIWAERTMSKHYKKITDLAKEYGCKLASVDCDGVIDDLLPMWFNNGVNIMFPIEIGTWYPDFLARREKYGKELRGIGGFNKHVMSVDKNAVDKEIERITPWVAAGGYIPCPDHRLPPGTKWELVQYYCEKIKNLKL